MKSNEESVAEGLEIMYPDLADDFRRAAGLPAKDDDDGDY
jgi:hypothetical protein